MMFIFKAAKFVPVWTTILKLREIFVHQTLTEHAPCIQRLQNYTLFKQNVHPGDFENKRLPSHGSDSCLSLKEVYREGKGQESLAQKLLNDMT